MFECSLGILESLELLSPPFLLLLFLLVLSLLGQLLEALILLFEADTLIVPLREFKIHS